MERALVDRLRAGEADALTAAYEQHGEAILRFLVRLCGRRDLAEDLFQETWVRLARHARALEPDTPLRAWLYTVARNLRRDHARWAAVDGERLAALASWWYLDATRGQGADAPDEAVIASAAATHLERGLERLATKSREVLLLVAAEGLAVDEAARVLGVTPEAARQRLHRARAELARLLTKSMKERT